MIVFMDWLAQELTLQIHLRKGDPSFTYSTFYFSAGCSADENWHPLLPLPEAQPNSKAGLIYSLHTAHQAGKKRRRGQPPRSPAATAIIYKCPNEGAAIITITHFLGCI
jgi:hypothetical protein